MRAVLAMFGLMLLTACGFQPMYANSANSPAIGPVHVAMIEGKAGHVLKTELDRILSVEQNGAEPAELQINISEQINRLGIRVNESASRAELRLTANYLITPPNGAAMRGSINTMVVYDIPDSAFGEISAQDDARERAAETLAQRMRAELALRFAQVRRAPT